MKEFEDWPADTTRRRVVVSGLTIAAAANLPINWATAAERNSKSATPSNSYKGTRTVSTFTTKDGTTIYYNDWGTGQPIVFSHGWPLSSQAFEDQMFYLASRGYRCIAHDRRGHGRSSQPWQGNDMDTYAEDLLTLVEKLDLKNAVHVGHSTGGGEVARYIGRYGTKRVAKAVLISSVPPIMLKSPGNPDGLPLSVFDGLRAGVQADRSQFFKDLSMPFFGYNRPSAKISEGVRESFWLQAMTAGFPAAYFCIKAFSETDQTEDLKRMTIPSLVIQGDDDQIVPFTGAGQLQAKLIPNAKLIVVKGAPHGLCTTRKDEISEELYAFIKG
jgi:non-heme chloroperoxidase